MMTEESERLTDFDRFCRTERAINHPEFPLTTEGIYTLLAGTADRDKFELYVEHLRRAHEAGRQAEAGRSRRLLEGLMDATAHLVGAASAYRKFASRHSSIRPTGEIDALFQTRSTDFDRAAERAQELVREEYRVEEERPTTLVESATRGLPENCRERKRLEGQPYPRSSCQACGTSVRTGLRCPHLEM